jgi:hypothetical protein
MMEEEERPTRDRVDRVDNRYEVYEMEVTRTIDPMEKDLAIRATDIRRMHSLARLNLPHNEVYI